MHGRIPCCNLTEKGDRTAVVPFPQKVRRSPRESEGRFLIARIRRGPRSERIPYRPKALPSRRRGPRESEGGFLVAAETSKRSLFLFVASGLIAPYI